MVAASILPIAWHDGEWRVLFGKECSLEESAKGWSDFGGRVDEYDPRDSDVRSAIRILQGAAREGMEETTAFLGDAKHILRQLIAYGRHFSAATSSRGGGRADDASAPLSSSSTISSLSPLTAPPSTARSSSSSSSAASDFRTSRKHRRRLLSAQGSSSRSPSPHKKKKFKGRSSSSDMTSSKRSPSRRKDGGDLEDICRPLVSEGIHPVRDWDCLVHENYHVFFYPVEYASVAVGSFNANHALVWRSLDTRMLQQTKLFEKSEMRWYSLEDIRQRSETFRPFYRPIADAIAASLASRPGPPGFVASSIPQ